MRTIILYIVRASLIVFPVGIVWVTPTYGQTGWQWYKTDLHVHSSFSADGYNDLGILSEAAKREGYHALFLTDHNLGSSFPISGLTANHMVFEDSYRLWTPGTQGSLATTTNTLVSAPVNTGTAALHLQSTSASHGETFIWASRGPNFRSGKIELRVAIYPTRIDPGSGIYVSASIGGDPTVLPPNGYTTHDGVITPGKSTVLVWQLGTGRTPSTDPNARVITFPLGAYRLNTWNVFTIDVSAALASIPAADRPLDYNGLTTLKIAASATGGTADAYVDTYSLDARAPVSPADEFAYRSTLIRQYNTSSFRILPGLEMGTREHAQRFNFGITDPSKFVSYSDGVNGIVPTQQTGYLAMLNHPGDDGGADETEVLATRAFGADLIEIRKAEWVEIWDALLNQGVQILGAGSTDLHKLFSTSSYATHIYAPMLNFDTLMRSLFEGRTYVATGSFAGKVMLSPEPGRKEPYPARYPVFVSDSLQTTDVELAVTNGLSAGSTIHWIVNGQILLSDPATQPTYLATKTIPLSGPRTVVRAEVRNASNVVVALTQPIAFVDVPGLATDKRFSVDGITTVTGKDYTQYYTKGISGTSWKPSERTLELKLQNPTEALIEIQTASISPPEQVFIDDVPSPSVTSMATYAACTDSCNYYDVQAAETIPKGTAGRFRYACARSVRSNK